MSDLICGENGSTGSEIIDRINNNSKKVNDNLLMNAGFNIWQRGELFDNSAPGAGSVTADRWFSNGGVFEKAIINGSNAIKMTGNIPGQYLYINQKIENGYLLAGKTVTISFDWESITPATTSAITFKFGSNTEYGRDLNLNTSGRKSLTYTLAGTYTIGDHLQVAIRGSSNAESGGDGIISKCKLEIGDTATDYIEEKIGTDYINCYRFYWKWVGTLAMSARATNSVSRDVVLSMPSKMRAEPNFTFTAQNGSNITNIKPTGNDLLLSLQCNVSSGTSTEYITSIIADADIN